MRDLAELFKALADETRLEILTLLLIGGELCVCDVEGALAITQSKASRHLRYLRAAGLVVNRREGVWMHYQVPADLDAPRREVLRTAGKLITKEQEAALEQRLRDWYARKQETELVCTTD